MISSFVYGDMNSSLSFICHTHAALLMAHIPNLNIHHENILPAYKRGKGRNAVQAS
jgi:hypothetical protein